MNACLRDPGRNVAVEDDFPMTDHTERCRLCAFGRLCHRERER